MWESDPSVQARSERSDWIFNNLFQNQDPDPTPQKKTESGSYQIPLINVHNSLYSEMRVDCTKKINLEYQLPCNARLARLGCDGKHREVVGILIAMKLVRLHMA